MKRRVIVHPSAYCSLYRKCPYSYQLMREAAPALRDMRPPFEGSLCQTVLDRWFLENKLVDPKFPETIFPATFDKYFRDSDLRLLPGETRESLYAECRGLLDNYIVMLRREDLLRTDSVRTEFKYGWDDAPLRMTEHWDFAGASDYHKAGPDGDEIFDGKCSRRAGTSDYMQLFMYAAAAEERLKRPVKAVHFLYYRQMVKRSFPFNAEIKGKVLAQLERACQNILAGSLPAKPGKRTCGFCRYRQACRYSEARPV